MLRLKETILIDNKSHTLELYSVDQGKPTMLKLDDDIFVRKDIVEESIEESIDIEPEKLQDRYAERAKETLTEINYEIAKPEEKSSVHSMPFSHSEILRVYSNATIYCPVLDSIYKSIGTKFSFNEVSDKIKQCYKEAGKQISEKTLKTYTKRYIQYMKLKEKITTDKKSGMYIKIPEKHIKPRKELNWQRFHPKEEILEKYSSAYLYKPIKEAILKALPQDKFKINDLSNFLKKFYKDNFKKIISEGTAKLYATGYIKSLEKSGEIVGNNKEGFKKKEVRNMTDKPLSDKIYECALQSNWHNTSNIPLLKIQRRFPENTSDEIKIAISKLIQEGKAYQTVDTRTTEDGLDIKPDRVRFKAP